ncbi:MAG: hypothetical protein CVV25_05915 [Ignavibacteriae bacterium HGW-Ignavibacteriae-4]|jgi:outer membrane protein OmpA-like peptidoglycan-associated protein|nr:MAG: hypothetical protein CVV25_05915 [Ignavibacteriae bacterium HGW-Ignavibacteriae-4]
MQRMNGIASTLLLLIIITSNLYPNNTVFWADKIISYSSQVGEKQFSANQALGSPSSYSNEKVPTAWMPKITPNEIYENIILEFNSENKSNYIFINMPVGGNALESVNVISKDSKETSVLNIDNIKSKENGRYIIKLPTQIDVHIIKIYFDLVNTKSEVLLDAVGIGTDTSNIWELNEIQEQLFSSPPENLGTRINSVYSELAPIISADGSKLFFTRDEHPDNIGLDKNQDVWMSQLEEDGRFSQAINLYEPVNNKHNNFAFSTNSDGTMLLMGKSNKFRDLASLSYVKFENNEWSDLQKFDFTNIGNKTNFVNFSLSQSMNIMFISMEREDSYGGLDLYYTTLSDSGWTEIKNLGASVNTASDEITPYISNDNKTLYFATNGRPGYGSMDLFVTKTNDDYSSWSTPKNLGSDINSQGWEAYFTISSQNDYAYFVSSNNSIGKEDIFRIQLPKEAQPEKSVIVSGIVTNENTNEAIGSKLEFRNLTTNKIVGIANSDSKSGFYQIVLPKSDEYGVNTIAEGFYSISKTIVFGNSSSNTLQLDLSMKPVIIGETYELSNIFFDFGKSVLDKKSNSELQSLIKFLKQKENLKILILGYTDEIGTEMNNKKLSEERAKSVFDYLINNGINKNRLTYEGKGEIKSNKIGKLEESRKVEFKIITDSK